MALGIKRRLRPSKINKNVKAGKEFEASVSTGNTDFNGTDGDPALFDRQHLHYKKKKLRGYGQWTKI